MIINFDELDKLKFKFVDLGKALSDLSENNSEYFNEITRNTSKLKSSLSSVINQDALKDAVDSATSISKQVDDFSKAVTDISRSFVGMELLESNLEASASKFSSFANSLDSFSKSPSKKSRNYSKALTKGSKVTKKKDKPGLVSKELASAASIIESKLKSFQIPTKVGTIAATGLLWMAFGFTEATRLKAQAGLAKNILVTAVDGASEAAVAKGTKWLSLFAEKMDKFYGISEKEIMGLAKQFTHMGFSIDEAINKKSGPAVENLHGNFISLSLSLDKMMEQATGTNAAKMGDYANKYGMSLKDSSDSLTKMYALGKAEGSIGPVTFLNSIEKSLDSLSTMGYKVSEVVDSFEILRKRFEDVGVPKYLAASTAAEGIKGITEGMQNAGTTEQVLMAELAGYGEGSSARIQMLDATTKLSDGNDDAWKDDIHNITKKLLSMPNMDEYDVRTYLKNKLKMGFSGAMAAVELVKARASGDTSALAKSDESIEKFRKEQKEALKTESLKMNELKKLLNEWKVAQRLLGQGLFGLAMDTFAVLIAFFKSAGVGMGTYLQSNYEKGKKEREALMNKVVSYGRNAPAHVQMMSDGLSKAGEVVGRTAAVALGSTIKIVLEAHNFNPFAKITGYQTRGNANWGVGGSGYETTPISKVVTIPVPEEEGELTTPQGKDILNSTVEYTDARIKYDWVGGTFRLVTHGVTESGDLKMGLEGNCPRCGLLYAKDGGLTDTSTGISGVMGRLF